MRRLFFVLLVSCTPAEQQIASQDGARIAADFAACVLTHRSDTNATPEGIATMCGVAVVPDVLKLIADEIAAAQAAKPASSAP
jgi:hypothetical protein